MRFWGLVCFFISVAGMAAAQQFPAGQCAVVVASRPTLVEAQDYRANHPDYRISEIYLSKNGWYALIVDRINRDDANSILNRRKSAGLIPDDSYCSSGRLFVQRVWSRAESSGQIEPLVPASELFAEFDARVLDSAEKRFLQASLALTGDYDGRLDGQWGRRSQSALEKWSVREFGELPSNFHVAFLAATGQEMLEADDWDAYYEADLDISLLLPFDSVYAGDDGVAVLNIQANDGSFSFFLTRMDRDNVITYHNILAENELAGTEPYILRKHDLWVTARSDAEHLIYQRADFSEGSDIVRSALFTASTAAGHRMANLLVASYQLGPQSGLVLPPEGALMRFAQEVLAVLETEGQEPAPVPSFAGDDAATELDREPSPLSSGSGFYINALGSVMTNAHVVDGCKGLTVAGRPARLAAMDKQLDLAVIDTEGGMPDDAEVLSFATGATRLNSDVTVAGYPLNGLLSTLNVTRGSVSALKGLDNDATRLQITAPVQAGNSGGPIVDRYGQVIGVVVAKMDGLYVANATGDLPQNVNFGIRGSIARIFAEANGVAFSQTSESEVLAPEDLAERLQKATVLVECF